MMDSLMRVPDGLTYMPPPPSAPISRQASSSSSSPVLAWTRTKPCLLIMDLLPIDASKHGGEAYPQDGDTLIFRPCQDARITPMYVCSGIWALSTNLVLLPVNLNGERQITVLVVVSYLPPIVAPPRQLFFAMASEDRAVLVGLYRSTGGTSWTRQQNWNTSADLSQWHGVEVNGEGRVVKLFLFMNNLQGIPESGFRNVHVFLGCA